MIPIARPLLGEEEFAAAARVLASGQLAQGLRVAEFEQAFARFIGVKHADATSSGTAALHTALRAHGIGPGDDVITTPFSFIASTSSILFAGARPVLADVDESFTLDPALVEAAITPRTRAIMAVHLYGQPADVGALLAIGRRHDLVLIEDACQAHGASFAGRRVGSFGTGCFSFYATKNMTTGEGGMLTTNDDLVAERARLVVRHGLVGPYRHGRLGYNFRLTELAAAIGLEQLKKLAGLNARRAANAAFYNGRLGRITGLVMPTVASGREHARHQYTLRVRPPFPLTRDRLVERLGAAGIATGVYYPLPLHQQPALRDVVPAGARFPRAERLAREVVSIPVHPSLTEAERLFIAQTVERLAAGTPLTGSAARAIPH